MDSNKPIRLVVHGGAGVIFPGSIEPKRQAECHAALIESLEKGYAILKQGGSSLDAVTTSVCVLEDCPQFNAGKGAVYAINGDIECDAGIMDSYTMAAGGVTCATTIKNPIRAARLVMEHSPHALLSGEGANQFAAKHELTLVDQTYFQTELRRNQLNVLLGKLKSKDDIVVPICDHSAQGTVGAVALDSTGRLASASSTGGLTGKLKGRVSDSSIVGAGFWADTKVAVSGTGNGDNFTRSSACRLVADLIHYGGKTLNDACEHVVNDTLSTTTAWPMSHKLAEASAGIIGVDVEGNICMPYNTPGMFRGYIDPQTQLPIAKLFND